MPFTPDKVYKGLDSIRALFTSAFLSYPKQEL
jgi:hypothetical protein